MKEHVMNDQTLRSQRFGWPVVVAVGVHVVLLVAPALDLKPSRSAPEEPLVQVELVEPPSIPKSVVSKPVPVVQSPVPSPPQPAVPIEPITTTVAEAPTVPTQAAQPTHVEAEPSLPAKSVVTAVPAIRTKARLGDNPKPVYPRSAREFGWEGTVMLRVEVMENGMPGVVLVHKTCGHEVLDSAALSAVQKWKFVPAMDGAFPIRSVVYLPVQFDLRAAR